MSSSTKHVYLQKKSIIFAETKRVIVLCGAMDCSLVNEPQVGGWWWFNGISMLANVGIFSIAHMLLGTAPRQELTLWRVFILCVINLCLYCLQFAVEKVKEKAVKGPVCKI